MRIGTISAALVLAINNLLQAVGCVFAYGLWGQSNDCYNMPTFYRVGGVPDMPLIVLVVDEIQ